MQRIDGGCEYVIIGAGPYGLSVASHLRAAGMDVQIFGKAMDFWASQMPKGMLLRSPWTGSNLSDPDQAYSLDRFDATHAKPLSRHLPLEDFVRYGQWFQAQAVADLDPRQVLAVERKSDGFELALEDGERLTADHVIVATGIGSFARYPEVLASVPREFASHASDPRNRDFGRYAGKRVAVLGAGQSAIESAAILHESGADVEVLMRQPQLRWLNDRGFAEWLMNSRLYPFKAPGKIGPIGVNWLIEHPGLFTLFPRSMQDRFNARAMRPAASGWLRQRTEKVRMTTSVSIQEATPRGDKLHLKLSDGSTRDLDHLLLGTGYKIDIAKYPFLSGALLEKVNCVNGYPVLNGGFESSIPGLYFVGAAAAHSFGPLCRFVHGTRYAATTLTRKATKRPRRQKLVPVSV